MKLFLTSSDIEDMKYLKNKKYIKVTDEENILISENMKRLNVIFYVKDGKNTLQFFKRMYSKIDEAIFVCKNFEYFFEIFDFLSLEKFQIIESNEKQEEEKFINNLCINLEKNFNLKKENQEKVVKRLFMPNLFEHVKTSFLCPKKYFMQETYAHKIINILKEKDLSLNEIMKRIKMEKEIFEREIQSLLFYGVLKKRGKKIGLSLF